MCCDNRGCPSRQATRYSTAGDFDSANVYQAILHQGRDPPDEPIPRYIYRPLPSMQDGGVPATYSAYRSGSSFPLARYGYSSPLLLKNAWGI